MYIMQANPIPESEKRELELIKLEYQQAAQRYENIYKAIWQIFSYMAVLTGAILTFGSSQLPLLIVVFISVFPLIFWWLSIFTPLDRYGQQVRRRLKRIERNINRQFLQSSNYKIRHYIGFAKEVDNPTTESSNWVKIRVSSAVNVFAMIILAIWIIALIYTFTFSPQSKPNQEIVQLESPVQIQIQDPQIQELQQELSTLSQKIDSIENLLRQKTTK